MDGKCGPQNPLPNGKPSECNPFDDFCCSENGECGKTREHCNCPTCIDYLHKHTGKDRHCMNDTDL